MTTMNAFEKLQRCLASVREKTDFVPEVALVLGSGLGDYGSQIEVETTIDYHTIEGFPVSTVHGHKGRFIFGTIGNVKVVVMQGRVHYYEGYEMEDVVLPTRLMGMMGAKVLMLTNAAGGVNYTYKAGDFMLIRDHIATFVPSPLRGQNIDELGTRFPDMSTVYDDALCDCIRSVAAKNGIHIQEGVYAQFSGPQFETPTEVRMCRMLGGDAVGMSTACEAIAANHMGMRVCGISCISNLAAGMTANPLTHEEVSETAERVSGQFTTLITESIKAIKAI
ncbi:MAG: purine-nucleoside phosphorylase [Cellulosilyticaceae bacterium]